LDVFFLFLKYGLFSFYFKKNHFLLVYTNYENHLCHWRFAFNFDCMQKFVGLVAARETCGSEVYENYKNDIIFGYDRIKSCYFFPQSKLHNAIQ